MLVPGFSEPVLASQAVFRTVMEAMARPGQIAEIGVALAPPAPLGIAAAALALTLLDFETPVWLDPKLAAAILALSTPQKISALRKEKNFVGLAMLGLLIECDLLFKVDPKHDGLRVGEGDEHLVLWDFHDLLFHTRSTEGRQANPLGGLYPYAGRLPPLPAERPAWPGRKIELSSLATDGQPELSIARLLRELDGRSHRLTCLFCVLVDVHDARSSF